MPVITIVNGVNNEQVGRVIEFALDNPKKINFLSFQPVSFTGRDEEITPERRAAQRYTLSHLAHDVRNQTGMGTPDKDWFPISFMGTFTDWADQVHGPEHQWGNLNCGCHPNCGVGMAVMVDKETKEAVPVTAFLRSDRLAKDVAAVTDAGRGQWLSLFGMSLALMRNYDPFKAPTHFRFRDLLKKFDKTFGATKNAAAKYGPVDGTGTRADIERRRQDRWNFLFIAGMWFQDLFNYDFRRTEMCIIPYATQQGEISFCAYNTGIGWRNIIEQMHMTATLTKWYEETWPARDLRRQQGGAAADHGALAGAQRRGRGQGRADRPRRARRGQERPRGTAPGPQAEESVTRGRQEERRDGAAVPPARAEGTGDAGGPDPGTEEGAGGGAASRALTVTRTPHLQPDGPCPSGCATLIASTTAAFDPRSPVTGRPCSTTWPATPAALSPPISSPASPSAWSPCRWPWPSPSPAAWRRRPASTRRSSAG